MMGGVGLVERILKLGGLHECFLCGKCVRQRSQLLFFRKCALTGTVGQRIDDHGLAPAAPCHAECLNGRKSVDVAASYHRWVADQADIPRAHIGPVGRA